MARGSSRKPKARSHATRRASSEIGEALVTAELALRGWIVRSLNTGMQSPNADLIAVKKRARVTLQVKACRWDRKLTWLFLGGGGAARHEHRKRFYNSAKADIQSDFVVFIGYGPNLDRRAFVVPVRIAERLARKCFTATMKRKTRAGSQRKPAPQVWACLHFGGRRTVYAHEPAVAKSLLKYEGAWAQLSG